MNVNQKIDEALKIARYAVTLQDITIVKHYDPRAVVKGNPDELLHVFVNLITNAVQAMAERGTLTLTTEVVEGSVLATVKDTGCGIPKEFLPKIFDPARVDRIMDISQAEATETTRLLAKEEGIFAGMSSGGAASAAIRLSKELESGTIVFIVCDRGDRYLSSDLFSA